MSTLTHTDEEWEREREREREIPSMHARLLSKGEPISSSSSNGLSSTDTGLNCSFCLFVHSCYETYHVHLIIIIIIKNLLKIIHIASVSTRNATSHISIPKKKSGAIFQLQLTSLLTWQCIWLFLPCLIWLSEQHH